MDERDGRALIQRSMVDPKLEWRMSLVKRHASIPASADYNAKAARAKLMTQGARPAAGVRPGRRRPTNLAHPDNEMACFTCHTSWTTSCGGCHLPIEANWKTTAPPL